MRLNHHYASYENQPRLRLANVEDHIIYKIPEGMNWLLLAFSTTTAWTASAVVTIEYSDDEINFNSIVGAVQTQTAVGLHDWLQVTGVRYVRVRVSTEQSGSDVIVVSASVERTNGGF